MDHRLTMNYKGYGRKCLRANTCGVLGLFCWKIKEKHECPVKTGGVLLEIRNMFLPNRSLESYCSISQLHLRPVL